MIFFNSFEVCAVIVPSLFSEFEEIERQKSEEHAEEYF